MTGIIALIISILAIAIYLLLYPLKVFSLFMTLSRNNLARTTGADMIKRSSRVRILINGNENEKSKLIYHMKSTFETMAREDPEVYSVLSSDTEREQLTLPKIPDDDEKHPVLTIEDEDGPEPGGEDAPDDYVQLRDLIRDKTEKS